MPGFALRTIVGLETAANLWLSVAQSLLDVYWKSETPSTSGEGEHKFIFNLVPIPAFGRGGITESSRDGSVLLRAYSRNSRTYIVPQKGRKVKLC